MLEAVHVGHGIMGRLREAPVPLPHPKTGRSDRRRSATPALPFRPPPRWPRPDRPGGDRGASVAVAATVGAGPDQAVALAVL
ncbi:hypothetical protein, partial [Acetobacter aceti]|uniref:hypothetical protein n=1 Tax=Acetobacter aceti TaxID=435 RepID=UPI0019D6ED92